jgi:hypothetical protein
MSLDEYFDRLDAAFANLSTSLGTTPAPSPAAPPPDRLAERLDPEWPGRRDGELPHHMDVDLSAWMNPKAPHVPPPPTPTPAAPPVVTADARDSRPATGRPAESPENVAAPPAPGAVDSRSTPAQPAMPAAVAATAHAADAVAPFAAPPRDAEHGLPLGEAFSAFLAAEHGEPVPLTVVESLGRTLAVSDDLIELLTSKVLQRLSDRTLQEKVADIVSPVAERVVREEIDRLKASLR